MGRVQAQTEEKVAMLGERMDTQDARIGEMAAQIEQLRTLLGDIKADKPIPKIVDPSFDREVDGEIVLIRSKGTLPNNRILDSLRSWISRNNLEDSEIMLEGDAAAKRFTMRVGGSRGYAERKELMGSLRKQDGTYERFTCADATGEVHEVFVSTDKSPAM
eukprot:1698577-Pyramimonas_sp.AAC.1